MSDNDRMNRAKRIRQMREGQRVEEADEGDGDAEPADGDDTGSPEDGEESTAGEPPADGSDGQDGDESESGGVDADAAERMETIGATTAEVPSAEEMEAAMERTMERAEPVAKSEADADDAAGRAGPADAAGNRTQDAIRVLEFTLAGEQYCLDIQYIEEIVKQETITRVPNTPAFVEGVVDLRGRITTILNPKVATGKDDQSAGDLIVVFDGEAFEDQGTIGWVVDDVRQVTPVTDDQVNDPPMGEDYINGVIEREDDGEFVVWTTPDLALDEADQSATPTDSQT
jgi:purine-binding chemotaxis protein CheW